MGTVIRWLRSGSAVRVIQFLLLVNALPAFVVLMAVAGHTSRYFVWTVHPAANARVLGVMYGNAFLLAAAGWREREWPRVRVTMAVIAPFAVAATIVTFVTLDPFLAHPHVELAYWILMYSVLFVLAPAVLVANELFSGGRLPVDAPLSAAGRTIIAVTGCMLLVGGIGLLFRLHPVTTLWPLALTACLSKFTTSRTGRFPMACSPSSRKSLLSSRTRCAKSPQSSTVGSTKPLLRRRDTSRPAPADGGLGIHRMSFPGFCSIGVRSARC